MASVDSLKVFAIAGHTDAAGAAVADVDQEELRLAVGAMLGPGILPNLLDQTANANAFRVRQDTGANMQVKVGNASTAKIDGLVLRGTVAGQGSYIMRIETTTVTITVPAADATNPSRYGVYAWINDTAYSGTASRAYQGISCIRGTPAGSPVTPTALAVWSASVLLWEFQLPALATAVTNTILDSGTAFDRRVAAVSPIVPAVSPRIFTTAALRDAQITSPVEGQLASITGSVDRLTQYTGAAWVQLFGYTAASRIGVRVFKGTQSIATGAASTSISFDTEVADPDGWTTVPSTTLTVPAGFGGLYHFAANVTWGTDPGSGISTVVLSVNAVDYVMAAAEDNPTTTLRRLYVGSFELAAGDAVVLKAAQSTGSAVNIAVDLSVVRLAI